MLSRSRSSSPSPVDKRTPSSSTSIKKNPSVDKTPPVLLAILPAASGEKPTHKTNVACSALNDEPERLIPQEKGNKSMMPHLDSLNTKLPELETVPKPAQKSPKKYLCDASSFRGTSVENLQEEKLKNSDPPKTHRHVAEPYGEVDSDPSNDEESEDDGSDDDNAPKVWIVVTCRNIVAVDIENIIILFAAITGCSSIQMLTSIVTCSRSPIGKKFCCGKRFTKKLRKKRSKRN